MLGARLASELERLRTCEGRIGNLLSENPWEYFSIRGSSLDPKLGEQVAGSVGRGLKMYADGVAKERVRLCLGCGLGPKEAWKRLRALRDTAKGLKAHLEALLALRMIEGSFKEHRVGTGGAPGRIDEQFIIRLSKPIAGQGMLTVRICWFNGGPGKQTFVRHFLGDVARGPNLRIVYGKRNKAHLQPPKTFKSLLSDSDYHLAIPALESPAVFNAYVLAILRRYRKRFRACSVPDRVTLPGELSPAIS